MISDFRYIDTILAMLAIIVFILEYRFVISQRLVRIFALIFNKMASIDLTIWVESDNDFLKFNKTVISLLNKEQLIDKVKSEKPNLEISLKGIDTDLIIKQHNPGIYIMEIGRMRNGLWYIKKDLRRIIDIISKLDEKKLFIKITNISLNLRLPYRWRHVKPIKPRGYKVNNYQMEVEDTTYKCRVTLNMEKIIDNKKARVIERINFKDVKLEQLTDVLGDFIKLF